MKNIITQLANDEAGFIVSAELVLVSTIAVLGLVVGLSEVSFGINQELEDVGAAFGSVNQTYMFKGATGEKGRAVGSTFDDTWDNCDDQCDVRCDAGAPGESY